MVRRVLIVLGALVALLAIAGAAIAFIGPLQALDAVLPKDRGSAEILHGAAYGANPRQRLDVYAPTDAGGPRPIIVFIYGGSWSTGSKDGYGFLGRALAARGFVVAIPDYRLYPEVRFPAFIEDAAAAVAWARAHAAEIGGDPDRIVLMGQSAGAYIAAMLALDERWLATAGVPREAIRGWAGLAGPYDFLPLDSPITIRTFGDAPDLPATQPINFAGAGDPPTFLGHGADDTTVGPYHSERVAARLMAAGVPVEHKVYPNLAHLGIVFAIARPFRSWAPVLDDVSAFARSVTEP